MISSMFHLFVTKYLSKIVFSAYPLSLLSIIRLCTYLWMDECNIENQMLETADLLFVLILILILIPFIDDQYIVRSNNALVINSNYTPAYRTQHRPLAFQTVTECVGTCFSLNVPLMSVCAFKKLSALSTKS